MRLSKLNFMKTISRRLNNSKCLSPLFRCHNERKKEKEMHKNLHWSAWRLSRDGDKTESCFSWYVTNQLWTKLSAAFCWFQRTFWSHARFLLNGLQSVLSKHLQIPGKLIKHEVKPKLCHTARKPQRIFYSIFNIVNASAATSADNNIAFKNSFLIFHARLLCKKLQSWWEAEEEKIGNFKRIVWWAMSSLDKNPPTKNVMEKYYFISSDDKSEASGFRWIN